MGGGGEGKVVKTNWQNLLGGLVKFLSWHNLSPLTLPSHPTQATDDDRSLKKVRNFNPRPRKKKQSRVSAGPGWVFLNRHTSTCVAVRSSALTVVFYRTARAVPHASFERTYTSTSCLAHWPSAHLAPFSVIKVLKQYCSLTRLLLFYF